MESPQIIVPVALDSKDIMRLELGNFSMTNHFEWHTVGEEQKFNFNIFSLQLSNTNIKTERTECTFPILHDIVVNVGLILPVSSIAYPYVPQLKV